MDHYLKEELYRLVQTDPKIFEFLKNGSLDGLWYWDMENPKEEWLSPRFKEVFGYRDEEIPNTSDWWKENIHPDDLGVALDNFARHCEDESHPYDQLVRYFHKDGSTVWVRCRGLAIRNAEGKPIRMLGAHTDVSSLKEAELALALRTKELERLNSELTLANSDLIRFALAASHDLREPLRMITSYLELLSESYGSQLDSRAKSYMSYAVDGAQRMKAMLEGLLEVSKSRSDPREFLPINMTELVAKSAELFQQQLADRGGKVEFGSLPAICGEEAQMARVFQNLFSNSIKFANPERPLRIRISGEATGDLVKIEVEDNGIGFKDADPDRVFGMFKRLHSKRDFPGDGIGLALVKKIVEDHKGVIHCRSTVGVGTQFNLEFPGVKN